MTYSERNAGKVTSHKLLAFDKCPWCFKQEFIDMIPNPANEDNDNFVVGAALDHLLCEGQKSFDKKYMVVDKRFDPEKRMEALALKMSALADKMEKSRFPGGTAIQVRDYTKMKCEYERLSVSDKDRLQITNTMSKLVRQMTEEYLANELFGRNLEKKRLNKQRLELEFNGLTLSGEVDHLDKKEREFVDLKTTINILKADEAIDKYGYVFQMMYYHFLLEELYGERYKCRMFLVDKYSYFSRSRCYEVSQLSMMHERKRLPELLANYKIAEDTGIYLPSGGSEEREDHPYYWIEGHGRRKNAIII